MSSSTPLNIDPASLLLVSQPAFLGLAWACVAISLCFVALRIYVRLRVFRQLFDDDALIVLAWVILLTTVILWTVGNTLELIYVSVRVGYGWLTPPVEFIDDFVSWLHTLFAESFLHLCALYCIKFSFLAFFRKLGYHVRGQKVMWWLVSLATIAGWAISVGVIDYPCIFATLETAAALCLTPAAHNGFLVTCRTQLGFDFSTDFLILLIPINLLWKVRINGQQKLALIATFSLILITMIFSVIRVELAIRGHREDIAWFFIGTTIEITIAIIIACLVSYRSFFTRDKSTGSSDKAKSGSSPLNRTYTKMGSANTETTVTRVKREGSTGALSSTLYHNEAVPLDIIHVRNEYMVDTYNAADAEVDGNVV